MTNNLFKKTSSIGVFIALILIGIVIVSYLMYRATRFDVYYDNKTVTRQK